MVFELKLFGSLFPRCEERCVEGSPPLLSTIRRFLQTSIGSWCVGMLCCVHQKTAYSFCQEEIGLWRTLCQPCSKHPFRRWLAIVRVAETRCRCHHGVSICKMMPSPARSTSARGRVPSGMKSAVPSVACSQAVAMCVFHLTRFHIFAV